MRRLRLGLAPVAVGISALALAACGGGDNGGGGGGGGGGGSTNATGSGGYANVNPVSGQKKGGTLKVVSSEGFEHLDPGQSYFQLDYEVVYAVHRPLYSFKPDDQTKAVPDLAAGEPQVSSDGKTVTVKIKPNIKYSPGTVDRPVESKDVKYAIERGFTDAAPSGYAGSYFGDVVGIDAAAKGKDVSGIETPDNTTIVFKLNKPFGATLAKALSLPLTAPVPEEYAKKYDAKAPSTFDSDPTKQAFTGPYMITSYSSARGVTLKRNPDWDASTDYRPAYADEIDWTSGADANVAGRQVLEGNGVLLGDTPPATIVKRAVQSAKSQITFSPLGNRYVALNTTEPPFDNINVRKAVNAALDRRAMGLTRGGATVGDIATHILPPGSPGFDEAGGMQGPGVDFLKNPSGNLQLAQDYMKKAGYSSGKYTGPEILMVASNEDPASKTAQVVLNGLKQLGFKVNFRSVPHQTMYSKFCNVPKQKVNVCPNVGWLPDFPDGYAYLWVTFNGNAIAPVNNSNWPQLNDPKINEAMVKAAETTDPTQRNKMWGDIDRMITESAAVVPWFWDKQGNVQGKGTHGVIAKWNAAWDLAFSSVGAT